MKTLFLLALLIFLCGFLPQESRVIPVDNATLRDWNKDSFWFYPWGRSGTHKGIDIFAKQGTPVRATTGGIVLYSGYYGLGGNVVYMLGANWRFHYYAHLDSTMVTGLTPVLAGELIGTVGTSGNAQGKPPHLHYTIKSAFPRFWTYDSQKHSSWNRTYYLDPGKFLQGISQ
jgi:murein DD-endopeptidase MepM/ murein hydrolase activator NlpD